MQSLELKIPPVAITLLCGGLMWAVSAVCPAISFSVAGNVILAGAIAIIGGSIGIAGVFAFRRHATTVNPTNPESSSAVVGDGIFRFTRNPMYLGLVVFLAGWAVFLENVAALLVLPAFVAYMTRFQIRPEERVLLEKFGTSYADYSSRVRRWI